MDFKEALKRYSYGIGRQLGSQFAESLNSQLTAGYDAEELARGIIDEVGGQNLAYSQEELNEAFRQYGEESKAIAEKRYAAVREEGEAFLRVNAKKEGVHVTESGVQYEILKEGNGPRPQKTDRVTVHYHGTFPNGQVFDSSVNRGSPATFGVTQVIPGWVEVLQMMPVGSKWRVALPYTRLRRVGNPRHSSVPGSYLRDRASRDRQVKNSESMAARERSGVRLAFLC